MIQTKLCTLAFPVLCNTVIDRKIYPDTMNVLKTAAFFQPECFCSFKVLKVYGNKNIGILCKKLFLKQGKKLLQTRKKKWMLVET